MELEERTRSCSLKASSGTSTCESVPPATTLLAQHGLEGRVVGVHAEAQDVHLAEALLGAADGLDLVIDGGVDLDADHDPWPVTRGLTETVGQELARTRERVVIGDGHERRAPVAHLRVERVGLEDPVGARGMGVQVDRVAPGRDHPSRTRLMRSMLRAIRSVRLASSGCPSITGSFLRRRLGRWGSTPVSW